MYGYEVYHDEQLKRLIASVRSQQVQHAYVFEGAQGIGKRKAARLFAAALACENDMRAPCNTCHACVGAKADTNPDIQYINAGEKKSIGVDAMRSVVTDAYIKPFESARKVYVIEDGEALTEQAQNAFLKMLEEPPEYAVFIILVTNAACLLQTVISRCSIVRFTPVARDTVINYAKEKYPDADAKFLADYARGNIGRIDMIMESEDFFPLREAAVRLILPMMSQHKISAYKAAEFLEENKDKALEIVGFWKSMIRDIILIGSGVENLIVNSDMKKELFELSGKIDFDMCIKAEAVIEKAEEMLERYTNLNARAARAIALYLSFTIKKGNAV